MSDLPPPPPSNMAPPPGYVPYGGQASFSGFGIRPVRTLGKWLSGLIIAGLAAQALSVIVQLTLQGAADDFLATGNAGEFDDKLITYSAIALLAGAIGIAQLVVLIVWTYRMAKNGPAIGRTPQSFGGGATIAVNLLGGCTLGILPFFMWRELWLASDPDTPRGDITWKRRTVSVLIPVHLALVLTSVAASVAVSVSGGIGPVRFNTNRDDLAEGLRDKLALIGVSGALTVAASVVFLLIVRQLTERHSRAIGDV